MCLLFLADFQVHMKENLYWEPCGGENVAHWPARELRTPRENVSDQGETHVSVVFASHFRHGRTQCAVRRAASAAGRV